MLLEQAHTHTKTTTLQRAERAPHARMRSALRASPRGDALSNCRILSVLQGSPLSCSRGKKR